MKKKNMRGKYKIIRNVRYLSKIQKINYFYLVGYKKNEEQKRSIFKIFLSK